MIPRDWGNMSQAVWRSPLLPLSSSTTENACGDIGSGTRFKRDLLAYLDAYNNKKIGGLVSQLKRYDFSKVKAALIASVPSRQPVKKLDSRERTLWGWPALKDTIGSIPIASNSNRKRKPHIVVQISSIATLGQTDKWLKETFFNALCPRSRVNDASNATLAKFSIIFPTPDEIRRSLDGYASGGSIHTKIQSASQQKQLAYLRSYLCHWAGDTGGPSDSNTAAAAARHNAGAKLIREAGRRRAAPHIKTYIRFSDSDMTGVDWAMVTSANLSTQAWGAGANTQEEVRICSWEIGVLIWPDLFGDKSDGGEVSSNNPVELIPCFKSDIPSQESPPPGTDSTNSTSNSGATNSTRVGLRMPYDLPLVPYTHRDVPWCATAVHREPDWLGQTWEESG
ncbi:tyrosyl-DNA phosphodiesterase 1 [Arthroderma uncinatum]|uniref:tyrosyl-DNA phosphodiesterase 1 n=1 Tax=Arthroderma uncinatum TaxID=74035 RepID=UPI00144A5511|nr:tyrosyl-DNA phosphodiesterase 1 [Arthroderma uncinatum]KAF3482938.1 tyrosyl-DNA phosphodiesterase 1 [Arthroderma uncinatum]